MINLLQVWLRVALTALLSMGWAFTASAHEVQPAVADIEITDDAVTISLRVAAEPIVAGINLSEVADTNDSPLAERNDTLRALSPDALAAAITESWTSISDDITLQTGGVDVPLTLSAIDVPPVGDVEIRRDSMLTLTADLSAGDEPVIFGWDAQLGGLIIRQIAAGSDDAYEAYLTNGTLSDPMPRSGVAQVSPLDAFVRNVVVGFEHIVPAGLDHILFVLGLFFFSLRWRPLLWQVTSFTLAHTVTLALATLGVVTIPQSSMWIVETIIAASIVYVAVENIWAGGRETIGWDRIGVVFFFGLLHGLGFASVFTEAGLSPATLIASLVAFNVGVEIGQLAVIAVAFLLVGFWFGRKQWYRSVIAIPGSVIIATIGAYWVLNRVGWVGDLPYLT